MDATSSSAPHCSCALPCVGATAAEASVGGSWGGGEDLAVGHVAAVAVPMAAAAGREADGEELGGGGHGFASGPRIGAVCCQVNSACGCEAKQIAGRAGPV
ncbi:hypothetical protein ABZP36_031413 [Zizania latifolia]